MLYPLSYEGGDAFVQVRGYFSLCVGSCPGPRALGVPDVCASSGFLNRVSLARSSRALLVSASRTFDAP